MGSLTQIVEGSSHVENLGGQFGTLYVQEGLVFRI